MAKAAGVSPATVQLIDVVGVYLNPPDKAWCRAWTRGARAGRSTLAG